MPSAFSPPPVPSPSAKLKAEFRWLTGVAVASLTIVALVLCAIQYHRERLATLQVLESALEERVKTLEVMMATAVHPVSALRQAVEAVAAAETAPADIATLVPLLFRFSTHLVQLSFRTAAGGITAFPPPPPAPASGPASGPASAPAPESPAGTQAALETRQPVWSLVRHDKATAMAVVSYAEPAYRGNRRLGEAGAVVGLDFLEHVVSGAEANGQRLVLVDRSRHVLADSWLGSAHGRSATLALGEVLPASLVPDAALATAPGSKPVPIAAQGYSALVAPLVNAPWLMVCLVPEGALFLKVAPWLMLTLALVAALFVLLTLTHVYVSRRFIGPALNLVRLASAEASGEALPPQRVPMLWQPWFGRVTAAFATIRTQLARAADESRSLTRQIEELAQALRRAEVALSRDSADLGFVGAVLEGAPLPLMVLDRNGRIVRFNRRCEALTGVVASAARGRLPWSFLVPAEESDRLRVQVDTVLRGDGPLVADGLWLCPGSTPRHLRWAMTALSDDSSQGNQSGYLVAACLDPTITELP